MAVSALSGPPAISLLICAKGRLPAKCDEPHFLKCRGNDGDFRHRHKTAKGYVKSGGVLYVRRVDPRVLSYDYFYTDLSNRWIGITLNWVSATFGWYYLLAATLYIVFVIYIATSRYGSIKLGPEQSKPEFSLVSWAAMLFAAGIGIDLMFFSVAEPVTQYMMPPEGQGQTLEAARQAMVWTLFHYGLTGWSMYALMGIALGYFSYRYNLPLTIRSALYPIFGKRIDGPIGHSVDIAAVIGTIFGIATTLGIGVVQLNYGLNVLFHIPESLAVQAGLILLSVVMAAVSVTSGVNKGIRILSEVNVLLALGLILFLLFWGTRSSC